MADVDPNDLENGELYWESLGYGDIGVPEIFGEEGFIEMTDGYRATGYLTLSQAMAEAEDAGIATMVAFYWDGDVWHLVITYRE